MEDWKNCSGEKEYPLLGYIILLNPVSGLCLHTDYFFNFSSLVAE
jgi:hypothetical protein